VSEAGSRRQSREHGGGLPKGSIRRWKALGPQDAAGFDESGGGIGSGFLRTRGFGLQSRGERQRAPEVKGRARFAVDNTAAGRRRSEGLSFAAPARTARRHRQREARFYDLDPPLVPVVSFAEAGGSPSSEAPPRLPRQRLAPPRGLSRPTGRKAGRRQTWESNHSRGARDVNSVAEVGREHLSRSPRDRRKACSASEGIV